MRCELFCVISLMWMGSALAGSNDVMVDKVWMRESVPGQTSATVQLNLSVTKPARLLSVSSPVASGGEIQGVEMHHGKMETRVLSSLKLAQHSTVIFGTSGMYLVLTGLRQPLNAGDRVPLNMEMEVDGKQQQVNIQVEVKALELSYQHYHDPTVKDHR